MRSEGGALDGELFRCPSCVDYQELQGREYQQIVKVTFDKLTFDTLI